MVGPAGDPDPKGPPEAPDAAHDFDELMRRLARARRCPRCDARLIHTRLYGYVCTRCRDQPPGDR